MKKILLSIAYLLAGVSSVNAQILFGNTLNGGADGGGSIIKFNTPTNNVTTVKSFKISDSTDGSAPAGNLLLASDGKLYGMTTGGGHNNAGVIFSFEPATSVYTKLVDFDIINGANPYGGLVQATDGKLYGVTYAGGNFSYGVLFSFDPATATYLKLKDFDYTNGGESLGGLVQAGDGKLYGMTELGGSSDAGVIFSYDPSSFAYTKLKELGGPSGKFPASSFLKANGGKLYGVAPQGGARDSGVIFSFDPSSAAYTKLKEFDYANGGEPIGSMVQANNGKFYGMTFSGGSGGYGVIFSFDPFSSAYTKMMDFDGNNGARPYGSLMQASDGKLYAMTSEGGSNGYGVIFSIDPSASTVTKLVDNNGTGHARPYFYGQQFVEVKECTARAFFRDADGDGYGNADSTVQACVQPAGYVTDSTDCDDMKAFVHTGATEICGNGIDDNCDGQIDEHCNETPAITINNVTVNESQGVATLTVTLSHSTTKPVWILYFTKDGTAKSWGRNQDYKAEIGLLVVRPGSLTGTISIKINKDNIAEPAEYFDVVLLTSLNGIIRDHAGRIFITDETELVTAISKLNRGVDATVNGLSIKVLSNPSSNLFNVTVESSNKTGKIDMKIMNAQEQLLEKRSSVIPGETFRIGSNYRPGIYFIQAVQGNQRKTTTIIKVSE